MVKALSQGGSVFPFPPSYCESATTLVPRRNGIGERDGVGYLLSLAFSAKKRFDLDSAHGQGGVLVGLVVNVVLYRIF